MYKLNNYNLYIKVKIKGAINIIKNCLSHKLNCVECINFAKFYKKKKKKRKMKHFDSAKNFTEFTTVSQCYFPAKWPSRSINRR